MTVRTIVKTIQDIMRQDTGVDGDAQRISQLCWMFFLKIIDDQDQELEMLHSGYRSPIPDRFKWRAWAADPEGITGDVLLAGQRFAPGTTLYGIGALVGAVIGTAIGLRWMSERGTRCVLAVILLLAGVRLIFR